MAKKLINVKLDERVLRKMKKRLEIFLKMSYNDFV